MVEVMTDKATVEIPSPRRARRQARSARRGQDCARSAQVHGRDRGGRARQRRAGRRPTRSRTAERRARGRATKRRREPRTRDAQRVATRPRTSTARRARGKVLATPATRKLARDLGVESVDGARRPAPNGRVTHDDVRARHGGGGGAPAAARRTRRARTRRCRCTRDAGDERVPFRGVRKKIAENMHRSQQTAAHFTYVEECDCTELVALRKRAKARAEERGVKLSFLPFIVKAVVRGRCKKFPTSTPRSTRRSRRSCCASATTSAWPRRPTDGPHRAGGAATPTSKSLFDLARELDELAREDAHGQGDARRADRLDLHHLVAGHARRRAGDADHQLPRGGDPRRAQDQADAGGARRRRSSSAT